MKVKASGTGKLLDSLPMESAVADLSSGDSVYYCRDPEGKLLPHPPIPLLTSIQCVLEVYFYF